MEKQKLNEQVIGVISDSTNCISKSDAFVGDKVFNISVFSEGNKSNTYYVVATDNDVLLSIRSVREDLDENSASRMNQDIIRRVSESIFEGIKVSAVRNEAEDAEECEQPIMLKIKSESELSKDSKEIKIICSEINDWLDELVVMKSAKVSKTQAESYQMEYEKIMSADLLPHDNEAANDYSNVMCAITFVSAVISIFFYKMCVFPVITVVSGIFAAYRCYTNKNYKACVICGICLIIGIVFTYIGWKEFKLF